VYLQAEVETLLEQAMRQPPAERDSFLAAACENAELRREVADLLPYAEGDPDFLHSPLRRPATPDWAELLAAGADEQAARQVSGIPDAIGGYRIVRLLAYGGMGLIYEARRTEAEPAVALKLPYPGLATPEVLRRFDAETRVLARLRSPGIARLLAAGVEQIVDPAGKVYSLPFLVMELIRGERLDRYTKRADLSLADRLRVFAEVCDAVHHAHQQGVIHRDLKPANILVEDSGQPKILDFGIARLIDGPDEHGPQTTAGSVIGSLAYMSPEQLAGDARRADLRADIYALGVILYETLTGRLPFDLRGLSVAEAAVLVSRTSPPPLGTHDRAFRGKLERVATRAIEKDRERRYRSAAELAADVRRCLANRPGLVGPPFRREPPRAFRELLGSLIGDRLRRPEQAFLFGWLEHDCGRRQPLARPEIAVRGFDDVSQLNPSRPEIWRPGMAQASDATGDLPPIIIDMGRVKRRDLRNFREGHGKLALAVHDALEGAHKGGDAAKKELAPVVLVYRKKKSRKSKKCRSGFPFPF
jgi:serine/threonine protein kinase